MTTQTETKSTQSGTRKPGLFKRLFESLDRKMQAKAGEKASSGCCCSDGKDKGSGDKCC